MIGGVHTPPVKGQRKVRPEASLTDSNTGAGEAGLPEDITDHRLRASFANILNKRGVPLPTIQKLMRHSKVETTMIYIETREDETRQAINRVG